MWHKLYDFAYDATIGLVDRYRQKTIELIRLKAAEGYLVLLRTLRRHLILAVLALFAIVMSAVAIVVIPVAMVLVSSCATGTKMTLLACLGLGYCLAVALCLQNVLSEDKWMKASGFQELLDALTLPNK